MPEQNADELWSEYRARRESGEPADIETFVRDHPAHAEVLRQRHRTWTVTRTRAQDARVEPAAAEAAPDFTEQFVARLATRASASDRYRISGEIGRGGMGAILKIWDDDLRRHLAMKVILASDTSAPGASADVRERSKLARFLEEAQITGQLEHPGIVPVHELGLDLQGRAYFTMKLVQGMTLKDVFERVRERKDDWSTTRALGVLLRVCEAMAYAHDKGVIHRDLKPANVMVGAFGEVHVMDWGLARILGQKDAKDIRIRSAPAMDDVRSSRTDQRERTSDSPLHTMDGDVVGTPAYMAPEQAAGNLAEIGPQADVYALGAMLYELLAGHTPYLPPGLRLSTLELWRAVRAGAPVPLAELAPEAPLELVAICEKAMARDWRARYPDMSALARDLRAFLEHRVVAAYQSGAWAEAKKWIERNRPLAASLAAGVIVLIGGLVVSLTLKQQSDAHARQARANAERAEENARIADARRADAERAEQRAREETARAEKNANETRIVADFQSRLLSELSLDDFGRALVADLRREAEESMRKKGRGADEIAAELAAFDRALASANASNAAQHVLQTQIFDRATTTIDEEYGSKPLLAALLRMPLAETLRTLSLYELGERQARAALDARRAELGNESRDTLEAVNALGLHMRAQGRIAEAEALYREASDGFRKLEGDEHVDALSVRNNLALALQDQGKLEEAESILREVLETSRRTNADAFTPMNNLATLLQSRGKFDEAESLYREALAARVAALGEDDPAVLTAKQNFAITLSGRGKFAEAEPLAREAFAGFRRKLGDSSADTLVALNNVAWMLQNQGRFDEAEPLYRDAIAGMRASLGNENPFTLNSIRSFANLLQRRGRIAEAEPLLLEAIDGLSATRGSEHPDTLIAMVTLTRLLQSQGKLAECEMLAREALAGLRKQLGDEHLATVEARDRLGVVLRDQGKLDEAEPLVREKLASRKQKLGDGHVETLKAVVELANVLRGRSEFREAEELLSEAIERGGELPSEQSKSLVRDAKTALRDVYRKWHEAEPKAGYDERAKELEGEVGR
ncbi:MAG: tetratricopeptide repeat protein [Planctomycetota bacterium]